jgi:phytoene dehydrogenase-like protein
MVHDGVSWMRLGALPGGVPGFAGVGMADRARLVRLAAEVAARPPAALLAESATLMTEDFLRERGFGPRAIETVFRPFFGVVLADRSLGADAGYFCFLLGMLARGPALLPADGLGMVAEWAAGAVRQTGGTVETGARVASLEPDAAGRRVQAVVLEDGRRVEARYVVLAVDAPAARRLLEPLDPETAARLPDDPASSVTASFALARPLYRGRTILLNAAPAGVEGEGPRVDLVCQTTNITRPHQERGPHVVLATSVATGGPMPDPDDLQRAVGALMRRWSPGFPWEREATLIGVHEHAFAQFRPWPGVRAALPGPRTRMDNLVLAGDLTRHPSIEGAVQSGAEAARIVDALA